MEWISVKERMPEFCEYILVTNGKDVYEAKLRGAGFLESDRFGMSPNDLLEDGITHWMPLPEPPQQQD
jgi:hypothetical protein